MGTGRITLTGNNTYTGLTTVKAGGSGTDERRATVLNQRSRHPEHQYVGWHAGVRLLGHRRRGGLAVLDPIRSAIGPARGHAGGFHGLPNGAKVGLGYIDDLTSSITVEPMLVGDINHDGIVDSGDLTLLSGHWHQTGQYWQGGDLNYDGIVNASDLTLMSGNWNESWNPTLPSDVMSMGMIGSVTAVPEPSSLVMLMTPAMLRRVPAHAKPTNASRTLDPPQIHLSQRRTEHLQTLDHGPYEVGELVHRLGQLDRGLGALFVDTS